MTTFILCIISGIVVWLVCGILNELKSQVSMAKAVGNKLREDLVFRYIREKFDAFEPVKCRIVKYAFVGWGNPGEGEIRIHLFPVDHLDIRLYDAFFMEMEKALHEFHVKITVIYYEEADRELFWLRTRIR